MAENRRLHHPWLVAIWPGMGHVALNAGIYLLSKLNMDLVAEFASSELVDVDYVEVKDGIVQPARRPRNRVFAWHDPDKKHDLLLFLGEAQPPIGKYAFCKQLIEFAKQQGVTRVFTFAAMATQMQVDQPARVFGVATDDRNLEELQRMELEILEGGNIGGLNGILLAAAAESGIDGACLLGEMPHIFSQLPNPKASLAILEIFSTMSGFDVDFSELSELAQSSNEQLSELLDQAEEQLGQHLSSREE